MQTLSCLSEEMRSPHCKIVQNVINHVSSNANDNPGWNIYLLLSKWRTQDMKVTEALNEAKDNVKYLITLEPFIDPLYNETPDVVKDTLPALMSSLKWYTPLPDITTRTTGWLSYSKWLPTKWSFAARTRYSMEKPQITSSEIMKDFFLKSLFQSWNHALNKIKLIKLNMKLQKKNLWTCQKGSNLSSHQIKFFGSLIYSAEEFQSSWSCSEQFNNLRL